MSMRIPNQPIQRPAQGFGRFFQVRYFSRLNLRALIVKDANVRSCTACGQQSAWMIGKEQYGRAQRTQFAPDFLGQTNAVELIGYARSR